MRRILMLLLILLTVPCGLVTAQISWNPGPFLVSTPETSKDGVQASIKEDSAGVRELQVWVPAGRNIGRNAERILSKDLTARAFDEAGKEMGMTDAGFNGDTLMAVCNAGSCSAVKNYYFSVPKAETDRIRKVVVQLRNKPYVLTMEKYSPPNRAN